jgi:hypothetical protein
MPCIISLNPEVECLYLLVAICALYLKSRGWRGLSCYLQCVSVCGNDGIVTAEFDTARMHASQHVRVIIAVAVVNARRNEIAPNRWLLVGILPILGRGCFYYVRVVAAAVVNAREEWKQRSTIGQ